MRASDEHADTLRPVVTAFGEHMASTHDHVATLDERVATLESHVGRLKVSSDKLEASNLLSMRYHKRAEEARVKQLFLRGVPDELERQAAINRMRIVADAAGVVFKPPTQRSACTLAALVKRSPANVPADKTIREAAEGDIASWMGVAPTDIETAFYGAKQRSNDGAHPVIGDDVTVDYLLRLNKRLFGDDNESVRWEPIIGWDIMRALVRAGEVAPPLPRKRDEDTVLDAATLDDFEALCEALSGKVDMTLERARYDAARQAAVDKL